MALERSVSSLRLLKSVVKTISIVGSSLEDAVDAVQQSYELAKHSKKNKHNWTDLHQSLSLCTAILALALQRADETVRSRCLGAVLDVLHLCQDVQEAQSKAVRRTTLGRAFGRDDDKENIAQFKRRLRVVVERFNFSARMSSGQTLDEIIGQMEAFKLTRERQVTNSNPPEARRAAATTRPPSYAAANGRVTTPPAVNSGGYLLPSGARQFVIRSDAHPGQLLSKYALQTELTRWYCTQLGVSEVPKIDGPLPQARYVVVRGSIPGIYRTWSETQAAMGTGPEREHAVQRKVVGVELAEEMFEYADDCGFVRSL